MTRRYRFLLPLLLAVLWAGPPPAAAAKKEKKESQAVIAGSVFTEQGFALPGVPVTITPQGERKPKWRAASDARGEFAVRVPAGHGSYVVATDSSAYQNQSQTVEIHGEERVDLIFRLAPKGAGRE